MLHILQTGRILGERAVGHYRLRIPIDIRPDSGSLRITQLTGELRLYDSDGFKPTLAPISLLHGTQLPFDVQSKGAEVSLVAELDPFRLEAIETVRAGGSVDFVVSLHINCVVDGEPVPYWGSISPVGVSQSEWIDILSQAGYRNIMLLELPTAEYGSSPDLNQCLNELRNAQNALFRGQFRDAVGACRLLMETIAYGVGDKPNDWDPVRALVSKAPISMEKAQRIAAIRLAVQHLAAAAVHQQPDSRNFHWSREDATCILAISAAVMQLSLQSSPSTPIPNINSPASTSPPQPAT